MSSVPVTFVSSHARRGGAERYLSMLVERLGSDWVREVVCLEDGPLADDLRRARVPVEVIPTSPRLGIVPAALRLRRRLAATKPAVVHANGIKAGLVAVLARPAAPVLWVKHDFSWDGALTRFVAKRSARVVGVSEAVLGSLPRDGRAEVIHNAIEPAPVDREAARARLLDALGGNESPVVLLVGRLDPIKGHRELLAAAPRVPGDARFVFVGGPDPAHAAYAEELRAEAGGTVSFLGHRDDAAELIGGADVVVIPTVTDERGFGREGFPYVGLEALAAGTPVVGYADGGLPELVGDCGRLVPPRARDELAAAIAELLADAGLRERLAACGRERVRREFSLDRLVSQMQDRYREAAKSSR